MIVYKITNRINGRAYVGATVNSIERRFSQHVRPGRNRINTALCRAIQKHGQENFTVEVLHTAMTRTEMFAVERDMIAKHGTFVRLGRGYNLTLGGEGASAGTPKTTRAKQRMSAARRKFIATPEGAEIQARSFAVMMAAARSPAGVEARIRAIRAAMLDPAKMARINAGLKRSAIVHSSGFTEDRRQTRLFAEPGE